jgi:hypothetical protein
MTPSAPAKLLEGKRGLIIGQRSLAFSPKEALQGRVVDVERDGFLTTMEVSCWSFIPWHIAPSR